MCLVTLNICPKPGTRISGHRNWLVESCIRWIGLTLIDSEEQDTQAIVEFEARMVVNGQIQATHEKSNFVVMQGKWLYTNGEMLAPTFQSWKPGRNEPCPCGSGKKFKRCCARP